MGSALSRKLRVRRLKKKIIAGSKLKNGLFHKKVFNQVEMKKRHKSDAKHDTHQHGAAQQPRFRPVSSASSESCDEM